MKWFKLYSEARNDRKLMLLSDSEHRVWFNLLCMASENEKCRGSVVRDNSDGGDILAIEVAGGDTDLLDAVLTKLQKLRMVTVNQASGIGLVTFNAFDKRQQVPASELPEAVRDRKRLQREREREQNEPQTVMSQDVTECHGLDKTRSEEIRSEENIYKKELGRSAPDGANSPNLLIKFVKPTIEEIRTYFGHMRYDDCSEAFFDYWETFGWRTNRREMCDWRAAVRHWNRMERKFEGGYRPAWSKPSSERLPEVLFKPHTPKVREVPASWLLEMEQL